MRVLLFLLATVASSYGAIRNRTTCFLYIDCMERAEASLKSCAGGSATSLALQSKDTPVAQLFNRRTPLVNACQDRLSREIIDFETLQVLVNEDARECFDRLPESSRPVVDHYDNICEYEPVERAREEKESFECLLDFKVDRQRCERLLECCPDHGRCAERMNAVSVAYQHANSKASQVVSNLLRCIASSDPTSSHIVEHLRTQRDEFRNPGLPFLRPDRATEERILRRLSLTSHVVLEQKRQRFNRKFHQMRIFVAQRAQSGPAPETSPISSESASDDVHQPFTDFEATGAPLSIEQTSSELVAQPVAPKEAIVAPIEAPVAAVEVTTAPAFVVAQEDTTKALEATLIQEATPVPEEITTVAAEESSTLPTGPSTINPIPSERRVAIVRNLLRNAEDIDLATYVSLIADGNFVKLAEIEKAKKAEELEVGEDKMEKIKDAIKAALATKESKTIDFLKSKEAKETVDTTIEHSSKPAEQVEVLDDDEADPRLKAVIDKAIANLDSETLLRAKKFADGGEAEVHEKRHVVTNGQFTGNGLTRLSTASKSNERFGRNIQEFTEEGLKTRQEGMMGRDPPAPKKVEEEVKTVEQVVSPVPEATTTTVVEEVKTEAAPVAEVTTTTAVATETVTEVATEATQAAAQVETVETVTLAVEAPKRNIVSSDVVEKPVVLESVVATETAFITADPTIVAEQTTTSAVPEITSTETSAETVTVDQLASVVITDKKTAEQVESLRTILEVAALIQKDTQKNLEQILAAQRSTTPVTIAENKESPIVTVAQKPAVTAEAAPETAPEAEPKAFITEETVASSPNVPEILDAAVERTDVVSEVSKPVGEQIAPEEHESVQEGKREIASDAAQKSDIIEQKVLEEPKVAAEVVAEATTVVAEQSAVVEEQGPSTADQTISLLMDVLAEKSKTDQDSHAQPLPEETTTEAVVTDATTEAPIIKVEMSPEAEKLMEKMIGEMKSEMGVTAAPQVEASTLAAEALTATTVAVPVVEASTILAVGDAVEGSGIEPVPVPIVVSPQTIEQQATKLHDGTVKPETTVSVAKGAYCLAYASCDENLRDYEEQCDSKYSKEVISHGIDDAEILQILLNSSISEHEVVLKACLRPIDRSVHATLKQLLIIQRGVRKACLQLGNNKAALSEDQVSVCLATPPSTESIDQFLSSVHIRSQENHLTCRAKLVALKQSCQSVRQCCDSVDSCDRYINTSPVHAMKEDAVKRLVKRQNDCESRMAETLKYIHAQLAPRPDRRRRRRH